MGLMQNVRVIQADQANKLAKQQLEALQKMAPPPVASPHASTPEQAQGVEHAPPNDDAQVAEIRQLHETVRTIAENVGQLNERLTWLCDLLYRQALADSSDQPALADAQDDTVGAADH